MTSQLLVTASLLLVLVILASVLGAVKRRERFLFVGGVGLFVAAHVAVTTPELGSLLAVAGLVVVVASTVPLLRQSV